jgi:prepilin-type N-terminal cleavage/methylation domain-containing protein
MTKKKTDHFLNRHKGFTLIELLVVISIIALLSSIVLASLSQAKLKGEQARTLSERNAMQTALEIFYTNHGYYPDPGNVGIRNCIAQQACTDASVSVAPITTGDFATLQTKQFFAQAGSNNRFHFINRAEASQLDGAINSYPHNTPLVTIFGLQYSGPFYVCTDKESGKCVSSSVLWTSVNNSCDTGFVTNSLSSSGGTLCQTGTSTDSSAKSY